MLRHRTLCCLTMTAFLLVVAFAGSEAMPPLKEAVEKWKAEGVWEQKVANWNAFKDAGGSSPWEHSPLKDFRAARTLGLSASAVDTLYVIVILVDFPDYQYDATEYHSPAYDGALGNISATPTMFQTQLFSRQGIDAEFNPSGSMTEFYLENSFGNVLVVGDIFGWYTMGVNYYDYVGADDGMTVGGRNLARDAVDAAYLDGVNFTKYANGDSYVDGVIVVHAGPGAETGAYGIWSHRSNLSETRYYNGMTIESYTMNPEEFGSGISTIGVFCHEYGHILGLPDLYDINEASPGNGIGSWSLMADGSWNGLPSGSRPALMDAWSKIRSDLVEANWLENNLYQEPILNAREHPAVYALGSIPGSGTSDYWLVENRQMVGFDDGLPGAGLCIYHVDPSVTVQNNRFRYMVAMEQADGEDDLAINGNSDNGDPYPGTANNRNFHEFTVPNSLSNEDVATEVGVWGIIVSGDTIFADLDVEYSRPWIELADADSVEFDDGPQGNGNGILEAGETIEVYFRVKNEMRMAYQGWFTLSVDVPGVTFVDNGVPTKTILNPMFIAVGNDVPVVMNIAPDFESQLVDFTLTVEADSVFNSGDKAYQQILTFEHVLGRTQVLLVDDDNNLGWEDRVIASLDRLRLPCDVWDKHASGSPGLNDLAPYQSIVWFTGPNYGSGGDLNAADISALKKYLSNNGGNLFLTSMTSAQNLHNLDSAFMDEYLHATFQEDGKFGFGYYGEPGDPIGDNAVVAIYGSAPVNAPNSHVIQPVGGGSAAFHLSMDDIYDVPNGNCAVTWSGDFRTVFTTFGFEFLSVNGNPAYDVMPADSLMRRVLTFFRNGEWTAVDDDVRAGLLPDEFGLEQNYPNPFNPTTTITYTVGFDEESAREPQATKLEIYNLLGRRVTTLVNEVQRPGTYTVTWSGTSDSGGKVASGVYFYRLETGDKATSRKMVLLK